MKTPLILLLCLPALLIAQSRSLRTTATISGITVYTSAAEMNYEKEVQLSAGKNKITFTDLTPFIVENSINVSVSDPAATIVTVSDHINYLRESQSANDQLQRLHDSIQYLKQELGLTHSRWQAAASEQELLAKMIGAPSHNINSLEQIEQISQFVSRRYTELGNTLFQLNEKEKTLKQRILRHEQQETELTSNTSQATSEITVLLNSPVDKRVSLRFKFLTYKAGWAPMYDFKYSGPMQPLEFIFRANVFNASAISWQEVPIRLSTADPVRGFALPSFNDRPGDAHPVADVKFRQIEVVNAITEYTIAQNYTIPADSRPYLLDVSATTMPASYNYLLIPKLDPFGFLMAKIPDWNRYNLIPGTSNIYNGGVFMGKTFLNTYAANDTLELYLGKDKNIQSNRNEKPILHSRLLSSGYSSEETFIDITVRNTSSNELPLEIIDQVPVYTRDDREKFSMSDIGNAEYNKTDGLITWNYRMKAGESIAISFKYEVRFPKDGGAKSAKKKYRTISCPAF